MKIEITNGENNPVTDFFSSPSNTPVTDEMKCLSLIEVMELPRERRTIALRVLQAIKERDEARGKIENLKLQLGLWEDGNLISEETLGEIRLLNEQINGAFRERDEARDQLIHLRSCVYDVIHSLKAGAFDELEKAWKEGLK
jgi:hypothetical protein